MALTQVSRGLLSTSIVDNGNATAIIIDSSENVSIPSGDLDVTGTITADGLDLGDASVLNVGTIALDTIKGDADDNTNITFAGSDTTTFTQGGTQRLAVNTLGINVTGTVIADNLTVEGASAGTVTAATFTNTTSADGTRVQAVLQSVSSACNVNLVSERVGANFGADFIVETSDTVDGTDRQRLRIAETGNISFYEDTGTTPKMVWDSSAETLAIGLSSANARLEVGAFATTSSDIAYFSNSNGAHKGIIRLDSNGDGEFVLRDAGNNEDVLITAGGDSYFNGGNLGIGTSSPSTALHVNSGNINDVATFESSDSNARVTIKDNTTTNFITANAGRMVVSADSANAVANSYMAFEVDDSEAMRIDSSGNVGIGTSSPTSPLHIKSATNVNVRFDDSGSSSYTWYMNDAQNLYIPNVQLASTHTFYANGQRKVDIDSSGGVRIGTSSHLANSGERLSVTTASDSVCFQASASNSSGTSLHLNRSASTGNLLYLTYGSFSPVGNINTNGTSVSYNTSSDQRLKENIADADDAGSKVDAIQVRKFDWIADGSHQDYGMVAQELQSVAPEAVTGDADSDEMMGVDYSKLVPMLVKEIQSLRTRVAQLENN